MAGVIGLFIVLVTWRFFVVLGTEVFAAAGLPRGAAGFEARSALVGAGYTTAQSEYVVRNRTARQVASGLVVFGYFGPTVLVALLGLTFVVPTEEDLTQRVVTLVVLLIVFIAIDRLGLIALFATRPARAIARHLVGTTDVDTWIEVGDHAIAAIWIPGEPTGADRVLAALAVPEVRVLAVEPREAGAASYPSEGETVAAEPGSRVVVMAPAAAIDGLRTGPGDSAT